MRTRGKAPREVKGFEVKSTPRQMSGPYLRVRLPAIISGPVVAYNPGHLPAKSLARRAGSDKDQSTAAPSTADER